MPPIKVLLSFFYVLIFHPGTFAISSCEDVSSSDLQKPFKNSVITGNQPLILLTDRINTQDTPFKRRVEEKEEIRKVIDKLFDGMRRGDSTAVRSVFYPSSKLLTAFNKEGKPQLKWDSIDEFVKAVGKPHTEIWDERIFDIEIQHDGLIASAWMKYAFYVDNKFSHCGVDAFQLFKGESGWKIIQITDTRYKDSCEEHRNKTSQKN